MPTITIALTEPELHASWLRDLVVGMPASYMAVIILLQLADYQCPTPPTVRAATTSRLGSVSLQGAVAAESRSCSAEFRWKLEENRAPTTRRPLTQLGQA